LRGDDLNAIKAPVAVRVTGLEEATPVARVAAWRIGRLFAELSNDGVGVAWSPAVEGTVAEGVSALETFRAAALEKERRVEVERFPAIVVFPQSSPGGTPGFQALSTSRDAWPLPSRRVAPMFSTPNH
jgi:hypothetical protein